VTVASPSRSTDDATPILPQLAQVAHRRRRALPDDEAMRHVLDAVAAARPSAARPGLVLPIRMATAIGGVVVDSRRKP
jgi:hypothetical protein